MFVRVASNWHGGCRHRGVCVCAVVFCMGLFFLPVRSGLVPAGWLLEYVWSGLVRLVLHGGVLGLVKHTYLGWQRSGYIIGDGRLVFPVEFILFC